MFGDLAARLFPGGPVRGQFGNTLTLKVASAPPKLSLGQLGKEVARVINS